MTSATTFDLGYGPDQLALADSVRKFCDRHIDDQVVRGEITEMPTSWWTQLAELGVLGLSTEEGGGTALEVAAAAEELGAAGCPGPLAATHVAGQLLEPEERAPLVEGRQIAGVGEPPLLPWSPVADILIEVSCAGAWLVAPTGPVEPLETTAGEPWGRVETERLRRLPAPEPALAVGDVALAGYLTGAGRRLLGLAAEHAAGREQFGQPIGTFQAVAHPLADVDVRLRAAGLLVRTAAHAMAVSEPSSDHLEQAAATARRSATRASLEAAYQAHQVFGAMGFTVEGPVAHLGQRVRQVSLSLPGPERIRSKILRQHKL